MFRSKSITQAVDIYKGMLGFNGLEFPKGILSTKIMHEYGINFNHYMTNSENLNVLYLIIGAIVVFKAKNSIELLKDFTETRKNALYAAGLFVLCMFGVNRLTEFIYFQF